MHICSSFAPLCLAQCVCVLLCISPIRLENLGPRLLLFLLLLLLFTALISVSPAVRQIFRRKEKNKWVQVEEGKEFLEQFSFTFSAYFCTTCKLRHFVSVSISVSALYMAYLYLCQYLYPRPCVVSVFPYTGCLGQRVFLFVVYKTRGFVWYFDIIIMC